MERRRPRKADQINIEKGFSLIKELMQSHPEIEPTLWAGAVWSVLVDGYEKSGVSYEAFCQEWEKIKSHYKTWWEK